MKRTLDNIIGMVGVFAAIAIGIYNVAGMLLAGPRGMPFIRTPLALLEELAFYFGISTDIINWFTPLFWLYMVLYILLTAAFCVALWRRTSYRVQRHAAIDAWLLLTQMTIALATDPQLLFIVAAEIAFVLPRRNAFLLLGAQMVAYVVIQVPYLFGVPGLLMPALDLSAAIIDHGLTLAWMAVAFGIGYLAAVERRGRLKLAAAHAQLQATQQFLADTLRVSERVRISRNLHDAIGHHLTALNLHLELGLRQSGDAASESFQVSRKLAQGLLGEVRGIVGIEREDHVICLKQALATLCSGIPAPRIDLAYDDTIEISDPALAHVIFRCIQEAITNAIRHSGATNVQIEVCKQADGLAIHIGDDGKGVRVKTDGNGLRGMRERVDEMGGSVTAGNRPQGGFGIHVQLPYVGAYA
ncbi:MAG TPA: histidine kinase [Burkholderiaceae bacterium]|nr:histidine kinase [Burkholderiaceae bacterium]